MVYDTQVLTAAQAEVLAFIRECCDSTGIPPSYREIQAHFKYKAVGTVQDHVKALIKKGKLPSPNRKRKERRKARGLLPVGYERSLASTIPIYGEIAAGPMRASEQITLGHVIVRKEITKELCFALRVTGNSMIEAGIIEGDILIVEKTDSVSNNDIVVALVDGETTVKRYLRKQGKTWLVPENKSMKPIPITTERFEIQGKVVSLQRNF